MPDVAVYLFGAPRIVLDGGSVNIERRKTLTLLAYLAVTGRAHSREELITLLWPDLDAARGRAQLRNTLADLQRVIGKGWLDTEGDQVKLAGGRGLRIDVGRFHELIAQVAAHSHPPHRPCDACLTALTEAANLYAADFLAGFTLDDAAEFDAWQSFQTESLRLELAGVLEKLAMGLAGRQEYDAAISHARRWSALDPLHEPAQRLLMQLYVGAGDRAAAVRQYQECVKVLQAELGIEPEPETTALFEAIRGGTTGQPAPALPFSLSPTPAHNLPPDPTPFIGRERELAQIAERLADPACRLLTILGPGGMGKTRLAIQAARSEADRFAHGACFVDLAPIASAEQLAEAILRTLQVPAQGATEPDQQAMSYLADKQMLLVLDNYEQLLTGPEPERRDGEGLVTKILGAAPRIKLLVTSRARLNVRAEWLAPLEGLAAPEEDVTPHLPVGAGVARSVFRDEAISHLEEIASLHPAKPMRDSARNDAALLETYSATALFLACVCRVQPDFRPTAGDARCIVHICRLLEGSPLAIELAAAWIRALPLAQIERELEHGLDFLATTMHDVPLRHRSMTATFDHSWRLLSPSERSILRQLSVFRGGFTREAAHEVTTATVADLAGLADASWLRLGAHGRYQIHELVRQYCAEKLETEHEREAGETINHVHDRHASCFASIIRLYAPHLDGSPGEFSLLVDEVNNLLVAWDWVVMRDDLDVTWAMLMALWTVANAQSRYHIVFEALETSLRQLRGADDDGQATPDRQHARKLVCAQILIIEGCLLHSLGQEKRRENCHEDAARVLGQGKNKDPRWREAHWYLRREMVNTKFTQGDHAGAIRILETLSADLFTGRVRPWPYGEEFMWGFQSSICLNMAGNALYLGQYEDARRHTTQGLIFAERFGSQGQKAACQLQMLRNLIWTGDFPEAERCGLAALRTFRVLKHHTGTVYCQWNMGRLYVAWGRYEQARAYCRRNLAFARDLGLNDMYNGSLYVLAEAELGAGNVARARLLGEEALARSERPECANAGAVTNSLIALGEVMLVSSDPQAARARFTRVLETSPGSLSSIASARAISGLMRVLLAQRRLEHAAELCGFLLSWPISPYTVRQQAERVARELEAQLSPEVLSAAIARGRPRRVDEVVAELVGR